MDVRGQEPNDIQCFVILGLRYGLITDQVMGSLDGILSPLDPDKWQQSRLEISMVLDKKIPWKRLVSHLVLWS